MIRLFELLEKVKSYDPYTNEDIINKAYVFSMKAHGSQKRASGDPYFLHPLEVAGILTDLKLDWKTIVTALLHDTVEDTPATLEEIKQLFGKDIATLVDGVTKLSKIEKQCIKKTQAENFRKFLLAMSKDLRVLLVKLADRLHNMRTLHHIKSQEKRKRIAKETIDIFAPLAGRIGLQNMRNELENLSFSFLHPKALETIEARLFFLRNQGEKEISSIIKLLEKTLKKSNISKKISGRQKSPYSIWQKMQMYNIPFENLSDIIAFRILVPSVSDCYKVLGIIHCAYSVVSGRFKDYISLPKPNGYRSIHTTVLIPPYQRVEIQIRTDNMHKEAEMGIAAHWVYKETENVEKEDAARYKWIRSLLDILDQADEPDHFLEHTKMEMFSDQVFCFTPSGDLITLPQKACPVDFAYSVHSDIGNHCAGAKINGKTMPINTHLQNGDQVEIITSPDSFPSASWGKFVASGKAQAHIQRFLKSKEKESHENLGLALLLKQSYNHSISFKEDDLQKNISNFEASSCSEVYASIGKATLCAKKTLKTLYPESFKSTKNLSFSKKTPPIHKGIKINNSSVIDGLITKMAVHFAKCCHPVPGDTITGAVSSGKGVVIHRSICKMLDQFKNQPSKKLELGWEIKPKNLKYYLARISIKIKNEPKALGNIATYIGNFNINISSLNMFSRSPDFCDLEVSINVQSLQQLEDLIKYLYTLKSIATVSRL